MKVAFFSETGNNQRYPRDFPNARTENSVLVYLYVMGRPKTQIKKNCMLCNTEFEVIKSREYTAKFCTHKCSTDWNKGKPTWNAGKKYEEIYTEEQIQYIKSRQSHPGELNPNYGKTTSDKVKKIISKANKGCPAWNKGLELTGYMSHRDQSGKKNPYIQKILKEDNITYDEYLERFTDRELYYKEVRRITNQQPIETLENYDKRGQGSGNYHLDHIYPITMGFRRGIPAELIGDIKNLQFIPVEENLIKNSKVTEDAETTINSLYFRKSSYR